MYVLSAGARTLIRFGGSFLGSKNGSSSNSDSSSNSNSTADGAAEKNIKAEEQKEVEKEEAFVDPTGATLLHSSSEDLTCDTEGTCLAPTPAEVAAALALAAAARSGEKTVHAVAPQRPAAHVTEEDWSHMQSYTEPQHLSLHTSQLSGVRTAVRLQSNVSHCRQRFSLFSVLRCVALYWIAPHCTILYRTKLYRTALHPAELHHTA
jgi:hypothetical protein